MNDLLLTVKQKRLSTILFERSGSSGWASLHDYKGTQPALTEVAMSPAGEEA